MIFLDSKTDFPASACRKIFQDSVSKRISNHGYQIVGALLTNNTKVGFAGSNFCGRKLGSAAYRV